MRRQLVLASLLATAVALAGCDAGDSTKDSTTSPPTPTQAPTAMLASNIDVTIEPPHDNLSTEQRQLLAVYSKFIKAQYRFDSHPWIIDPEFASSVLPTSTYAPVLPDSIGLIGPVPIEVLAVTLTAANRGRVETCVDSRALRFLGRDGAIDITGPAGDRYRAGVSREAVEFDNTAAAAADGTRSATPRWLASNGESTADAPQCKGMAATPPPSSTPRPPITATP